MAMKVFLSYTKNDGQKVNEFYKDLKAKGFIPWMDSFDLLPGMQWNNVIQNNMSDADVCIIFISENSLEKIGYVQRELNYFADKLNEMPENYIYCIPVVLDSSEAPTILSKKIQYVKVENPNQDNWQRVLRSLELAASQRDIELRNNESGEFEIELKYVFEMMNGYNGFQFAFSYPFFKSNLYKELAEELNEFLNSIVNSRKIKTRLIPDINLILDENLQDDFIYNSFIESEKELEEKIIKYEDAVSLRTHNNLDSTICDVSFLNENFVSFTFSTYWYGSGAAHANLFTENINFKIIDSKIFEVELWDFFDGKIISYEIIIDFFHNAILQQLKAKKFLFNKELFEDDQWLVNGLRDCAEDRFKHAFSINKQGWLFHFDPYVIDCFAAGKYEALIPHDALSEWYKEEFRKIFLSY